jgi:hypothetical protein
MLRKAPHVIRLKGLYDIAVEPSKETEGIDALHEAYAEGREPGPRDILAAMTSTVPLARLMDGQIAALRHWAKGRAREAASNGENTAPRHDRRVAAVNGAESGN